MATKNTCNKCKHWKIEQSIFDFQKTKGICLKAPENTTIGFHRGHKEYLTEGKDKGKPAFYGFAEKETERVTYFITRENFGCSKFEPKQL